MNYPGFRVNVSRALLSFFPIFFSSVNLSLFFLNPSSACTCPESAADHPGPSPSVGRGAPEIDVFEAQKNKLGEGGKVSQSAQFAPFSHDYVSANDSTIATFFTEETKQNTYQGSALQQAVTALTTVPDRAYAGTGGQFVTMGELCCIRCALCVCSFLYWVLYRL